MLRLNQIFLLQQCTKLLYLVLHKGRDLHDL